MSIANYVHLFAVEEVEASGDAPAFTLVDIEEIAPAKLPPEVPPPVWDNRPIDPDRAMAAVRAMCA